MRISEVAKKLGVTQQAIYYYLKNGLIECNVERRKKYNRYFLDEEAVKKLSVYITKKPLTIRGEIKNKTKND